jgi:hypothetical protein
MTNGRFKQLSLPYSLVFLLLIMGSSCSYNYKLKRETQRYHRKTSGLVVNTYKKSSQLILPFFYAQLSQVFKQDEKLSMEEVRMFLAVSYMISGPANSRFYSLAEAESTILLGAKEDCNVSFIAHQIRSSVMLEKGFRRASSAEEIKSHQICEGKMIPPMTDFQFYVSNLVKVRKAVIKRDFAGMLVILQDMDLYTGQQWPVQLVGVIGNLSEGNTAKAKVKFEGLMQDSTVDNQLKLQIQKRMQKYFEKPKLLRKSDQLNKDLFYLLLVSDTRFRYAHITIFTLNFLAKRENISFH